VAGPTSGVAQKPWGFDGGGGGRTLAPCEPVGAGAKKQGRPPLLDPHHCQPRIHVGPRFQNKRRPWTAAVL